MTFTPRRIGPLLELFQLHASERVPRPLSWLEPSRATSLLVALAKSLESWDGTNIGFIRARRTDDHHEHKLTRFLMGIRRSADQIAGLPRRASAQLAAAIRELESNIHEHSQAPGTGFVAYKASPGVFEFVVADRGIGVLQSLRPFKTYSDEGMALLAALSDGVSRHGSTSHHGHGFRPLFLGLVSLYGELRFRSGDHAVTMDGTDPSLPTARITQKVSIDGFFASVRCSLGTRLQQCGTAASAEIDH